MQSAQCYVIFFPTSPVESWRTYKPLAETAINLFDEQLLGCFYLLVLSFGNQ